MPRTRRQNTVCLMRDWRDVSQMETEEGTKEKSYLGEDV